VNNVRIITLYKLHNKLSCVSSASSHAVRQVLHGQNAWDRHVERVESCRVETSQVEFEPMGEGFAKKSLQNCTLGVELRKAV